MYHILITMKPESMDGKHEESPTMKKFEATHSVGKKMRSFFWDHKGIIYFGYAPKDTTIIVGVF